MQITEQEIKGWSIVLVGKFDVKQAHPHALLESELIRENDLRDLKIVAVLEDLVAINFSWITLAVETYRVTASTLIDNPMPEAVRDFVLGFTQPQNHSIDALGINVDCHFQVASLEELHALGHLLAPKQTWAGLLNEPGMRSLSIQGERDDAYNGMRVVKIEPSQRIERGIYVSVNDHYDFKVRKGVNVLEVLEKEWERSLLHSDSIVDSIKSLKVT